MLWSFEVKPGGPRGRGGTTYNGVLGIGMIVVFFMGTLKSPIWYFLGIVRENPRFSRKDGIFRGTKKNETIFLLAAFFLGVFFSC